VCFGKECRQKRGKKEVTFDEIDACTQLDEQRRHKFYADLAQEEEMKRFIANL